MAVFPGSAVLGHCTEAGVQQEVYELLCRAPPGQHQLALSSGVSVLQRSRMLLAPPNGSSDLEN